MSERLWNNSILTADGAHFFVRGEAAAHFRIDAAGKITRQRDVKVPRAERMLVPRAAGSPQAIAFQSATGGKVGSCICRVVQPDAPVAASEDWRREWFLDARTGIYCSVARKGEIVGYDGDGKVVFRVDEAKMQELDRRFGVYQILAPARGGGGILYGGESSWWLDLSATAG